jgi:hypothetical protein
MGMSRPVQGRPAVGPPRVTSVTTLPPGTTHLTRALTFPAPDSGVDRVAAV